ncbi:MAG TPA: cysteine desulfurase family protein [Phycisphaerae bacterium]|nr:cysteine desulfurase family protein [Phycisphaerae bacterium]
MSRVCWDLPEQPVAGPVDSIGQEDMEPIYLDYNATTPLAGEVIEAMRPFLEGHFGNPSSRHAYGHRTRSAVATARRQVADLLGATPGEIVFTGGGSEANNLALTGIARARRSKRDHIVTSAVEHPAVLEVCRYLAANGWRVTRVPVDETGRVDPAEVAKAVTHRTALVSVMHANNEVGTIQPIKAIAEIAHRGGALMHTDAAQSVGKIWARVRDLDVDLLSVAGHKLYGPKGVGALYIRRGTKIERLIHGADHESGLRAGTENVLGLVGLGAACELAGRQLDTRGEHTRRLRDLLYEGLSERVPDTQRNGHPTECLPNTLSLSFRGLDANTLLTEAPEIAASAGAACHSGGTAISATLRAMGVPPIWARGTVRFSTGAQLTAPEVEHAIEVIAAAVEALRARAR